MSRTTFAEAVTALGQPKSKPANPHLIPHPLLQTLKDTGTSHVYADTADTEELRGILETTGGAIWAEVDGNTANQPLVKKVIETYLDEEHPSEWVQALRSSQQELEPKNVLPLMYAIVCGRIGNHFSHSFASGRAWEVSVQLHMALMDNPGSAKQVGRDLRSMVPSAFVKVPFTPHKPSCFFVARDLEREGIPVNFTSTFSARQVVVAALLANVTRTNVFMGRLDQGLEAKYVGAHVDLEAQRSLLKLRAQAGVKTQLIVASMRQGTSFLDTAGCDVYTAPCQVIKEFLDQTAETEGISSQLETSYEDRLGISEHVLNTIGKDRIARLYRVEPELQEFLLEYRDSNEYATLHDEELLVKRFEEAGFQDVFYAPTKPEWEDIRKHKTPDLDAAITGQIPLDTLYTLMADADFEKHQEEMDRMIKAKLET